MKEIFGTHEPGMRYADLHMHTTGSDGKMEPQQVIDIAIAAGTLSAVAITDHDLIGPALEAREYSFNRGYELEVVVGAEISTRQGHLLGLFLEDEVPSGGQIDETIVKIHKQGGLVIIPHPMYKWIRSVGEDTLAHLMAHPNPNVYIDGFEVYNAGVNDNPVTKANKGAQGFYLANVAKLGAAIGSTDGHFYTVGRGLTAYSGDFKEAIKNRQTVVVALEREEQIRLVQVAREQFGEVVMVSLSKIQRAAIRRFNQQ